MNVILQLNPIFILDESKWQGEEDGDLPIRENQIVLLFLTARPVS